MKRIIGTLVFFLCFFIVTNVCLADKIDKANKLVKKGIGLERVKMYDEARELYYKAEKLIKEAIVDNPNNPDLHFRAGLVYLNMGKTWEANKRFDVACNVLHSRKHCYKAAEIYKNLIILKLQAGKIEDAKYCYQLALKFNPSLRGPVTEELFKIGNDYLKRGVESNAYRYFKLASQFSGSIKTEITKSYLKVIKRAKGRTKIFLCLRALEFDKENYLDEIIKIIGDEVKKIDPTTEERERYKAYVVANNLISRDRVKEAFYPDYKEYKYGIYYFDLKAGEATEYIVVPYGYGVATVGVVGEGLKFVIQKKIYNKNISYNAWDLKKTKQWPFKDRAPFKIISLKNQRIKLIIGKWDGFKFKKPIEK